MSDITPLNPDAAVSAIRSAVRNLKTWAAYVEANKVTRETVKDHADALARLAYPKQAPVQKKDGKRTLFGNAVQAAGNGMRRALDKDSDTDSDTDESTTKNLLTREGKAATREQVIAEWEAAQA